MKREQIIHVQTKVSWDKTELITEFTYD